MYQLDHFLIVIDKYIVDEINRLITIARKDDFSPSCIQNVLSGSFGCGLFRSNISYSPGRVGNDSNGSFDIIALGIHMDYFGDTDGILLIGLRIHRL